MRSRAAVRTERPSPYLKQICKHFRHKHEVTFTDTDGELRFPFGTCRLAARGEELRLDVEADSAEALAHTEKVVGGHLERFGRRDGLAVTWQHDLQGDPTT